MKIGKWDYRTKKYKEYELPEGASLFEVNMDKVIKCANCGNELEYGDGYTSKEIHTLPSGFGYSVCEICHKEELERYDNLRPLYLKTNKGVD